MLKEVTIKAMLTATTSREETLDALKHLAAVRVAGSNHTYHPVAEFRLEGSGELTIVLRHEE